MSKGERERKTGLGFNDISNIHADAFCCFVLSFSDALPARVLSSPHTPQPGRGEGNEGERGKGQVGKKEEKTIDQASKQANTKAFLCTLKGITYLILAGEEDKKRQRRGNIRAEKSKTEKEIKGRRLRKV